MKFISIMVLLVLSTGCVHSHQKNQSLTTVMKEKSRQKQTQKSPGFLGENKVSRQLSSSSCSIKTLPHLNKVYAALYLGGTQVSDAYRYRGDLIMKEFKKLKDMGVCPNLEGPPYCTIKTLLHLNRVHVALYRGRARVSNPYIHQNELMPDFKKLKDMGVCPNLR